MVGAQVVSQIDKPKIIHNKNCAKHFTAGQNIEPLAVCLLIVHSWLKSESSFIGQNSTLHWSKNNTNKWHRHQFLQRLIRISFDDNDVCVRFILLFFACFNLPEVDVIYFLTCISAVCILWTTTDRLNLRHKQNRKKIERKWKKK